VKLNAFLLYYVFYRLKIGWCLPSPLVNILNAEYKIIVHGIFILLGVYSELADLEELYFSLAGDNEASDISFLIIAVPLQVYFPLSPHPQGIYEIASMLNLEDY
jgi:hypothetical protein